MKKLLTTGCQWIFRRVDSWLGQGTLGRPVWGGGWFYNGTTKHNFDIHSYLPSEVYHFNMTKTISDRINKINRIFCL